MRKLLLIGVIAALCGGNLLAQPTPRPGSQPVVPSAKAKPSDRTDKAAKLKGTDAGTVRKTTTTSDAVPRSTVTERSGSDAVPRSTQPRSTAKQNTAPASAGRTNTATPKTIPSTVSTAAPEVKKEEEIVQIKWMTLEEAMERNKTEKRKIFIDVYTEWCSWCKRMDKTTFTNRSVAQYVNSHYYPVRFDAEQQQDIVFRDKTYRFKKNGSRGYHELAAEWLNNRLSYPTVVFLDENLNVIQPLPGYLESMKLEAILNYFGTDSHKTTPWETYERKFNQR
jgi:thioredoxin-related protein